VRGMLGCWLARGLVVRLFSGLRFLLRILLAEHEDEAGIWLQKS
jgi:hypothetical protein